MRISLTSAALITSAVLVSACYDADPAAYDDATLVDAVRGQLAFVAECATCHASGDGIDLATFRFTDTTIIRRALVHVDSATARNIVAHIRTLKTPAFDEQTRIFQPGGVVLGSDLEFATALFGADMFPADMTTARMQAINPREVRVAIKLPVWSDEVTNLDWMPDRPVPNAILDDQGGLARGAVAGYRAAPTRENLARAVAALRLADRRMASPEAPCLLEDSVRVDYVQCFQVRRWTSSLVAQHLLRYGVTEHIDLALHDVWWDVGNAARKSIRNGQSPISNARQNWASWMYMSWSFAPSQHASVYTGGGLNNNGLPRHATFVALRSQVARPRKSAAPYEDLKSAVAFAPAAWTYNAAEFAFRHLNERLDSGDIPEPAMRQAARDAVANAVMTAQRKVPQALRATIAERGETLKARLL